MAEFIRKPTLIEAAGKPPKQIEEFAGRVHTNTKDLSIARMVSPEGWTEPGQIPEFDEYSLVLEGVLKVETDNGMFEVKKGQAVIAEKGKWVRYSTPYTGGAIYIAVCVPAFSPDTVHRDS